jgi:hypothetical protein
MMSNWERERRKAQQTKNCMAGSLALGALSCELDRLRRRLEAGRDFDKWDVRTAASLASDVRQAFGGKSRDAIEMSHSLKDAEEKGTRTTILDAIKEAQEVLPKIMGSASDQCGKALRPPAVRRPKEPVQPPPAAAETP